MKKYDVKSASIVYVVWCIMSYIVASFYVWQWNPGLWTQEHRDVMTMFGPIFGVFIFLSVLFWEEIIKEESPEI